MPSDLRRYPSIISVLQPQSRQLYNQAAYSASTAVQYRVISWGLFLSLVIGSQAGPARVSHCMTFLVEVLYPIMYSPYTMSIKYYANVRFPRSPAHFSNGGNTQLWQKKPFLCDVSLPSIAGHFTLDDVQAAVDADFVEVCQSWAGTHSRVSRPTPRPAGTTKSPFPSAPFSLWLGDAQKVKMRPDVSLNTQRAFQTV